jgi:hypothetical protein
MSLLSHVIDREGTLAFSGLSPHDGEVEIPRQVADKLDLPRYPEASLKDVINQLPDAEARPVFIDNANVANNGIVDTDSIRSTLRREEELRSSSVEKFDGDNESVFDIDRGDPTHEAHDLKAVIDPRREAIDALGEEYSINYTWQVASSDYTIITPSQWYFKAHQTLEKSGERDVFGWVEFDDYGGAVDFYIFCPDQRFLPPGEDTEDREPVYLGFNSGYTFDGTRSLDFKLIGYDLETESPYWALAEKKSKPHRGNVMADAKDWWANAYEQIKEATEFDSELFENVREAELQRLDFSDINPDKDPEDRENWTLEELIESLDIPYADEIANQAFQIASKDRVVSIWNIYVNINDVLNEKYTGEKKNRNSLTFQGHVRKARKLLTDTTTQLNRAKNNWEDQFNDTETDRDENQRALGESVTDLNVDIRDEDELTTLDKTNMAGSIQESLRSVGQDDNEVSMKK